MWKYAILASVLLTMTACEEKEHKTAYLPKYAPLWEKVWSNEEGKRIEDSIPTYRMKTPHGWIVMTKNKEHTALINVPDQFHQWKLVPNYD